MKVIHATCACRNIIVSMLLPSNVSDPTFSPSPSAAISPVSKPHAVAGYTTLSLYVNQLAALSPSNAGISNSVGDYTCSTTTAVLAAAASGELLARGLRLKAL